MQHLGATDEHPQAGRQSGQRRRKEPELGSAAQPSETSPDRRFGVSANPRAVTGREQQAAGFQQGVGLTAEKRLDVRLDRSRQTSIFWRARKLLKSHMDEKVLATGAPGFGECLVRGDILEQHIERTRPPDLQFRQFGVCLAWRLLGLR